MSYCKFLLIFAFLFFSLDRGWGADFKITAPASWKKQPTTFPGQVFRNASSKTDAMVLISKRKNSEHMIFSEMDRNSDLLEKARDKFLSEFGIANYSLNSLSLVHFPHANKVDVVILESSYNGATGQPVQMIERQYYAGDQIYSVVYSEISPYLGDRRVIAKVMDQFIPDFGGIRVPAAELVTGSSEPRGQSKVGLRSSITDDSFQKLELRKPGVCDHIDASMRKRDSDPSTFSVDGAKEWSFGCLKGFAESLPALADGLAQTGEFIGTTLVGAAKGAWYYVTNPRQLAADAYAAPAVAFETIRNSKEIATRAFTNIAGALSQHTLDFACLKTDLQMKAICKFIAMTGESALLGIVAFRGAAIVAKYVKDVAKRGAEAVREVVSANRGAAQAARAENAALTKTPVEAPAAARKLAPETVAEPVAEAAVKTAPKISAQASHELQLAENAAKLAAESGKKEAHDFARTKFANQRDPLRLINEIDLLEKGRASESITRMMENFGVKRLEIMGVFNQALNNQLAPEATLKLLLELEEKARTGYLARTIGKSTIVERDIVALTSSMKPDLEQSMKALIAKGGGTLRDDLLFLMKNEKSDDVFKFAEEFKSGGHVGLEKIRRDAGILRSELSAEKAKGVFGRRPRTVEQIQSTRDLEVASYNGLKTFRHSAIDVAEVRKKYPLLNRRIEDFPEQLRRIDLKSQVQSADEIPGLKAKVQKRMPTIDPVIRETMKNVWNRMNDREALARYTKALAEDAAVEMAKNGSKHELDALTRGELTRNAVLKVLTKRHRAQGNDQFSTITGDISAIANRLEIKDLRPSTRTRKSSANHDFREAVGQGPFFDKPFGKDARHGVDTHFLQIDYVSDVVWNSTGKNPRLFWDYLGSKKGIENWVPLFDAGENTLASPEFFAHKVSTFLKITD